MFYPTAGDDYPELLSVFAGYVEEFHFCDLSYKDLRKLSPLFSDHRAYRCISAESEGMAFAEVEQRRGDRGPYRWLSPGSLKEILQRIVDGRQATAVRRRGFGQYALAEFQNHSIAVFVHRRDSHGEGGSRVCFLANVSHDHEPLSELFNKLALKLSHYALIVSDGSNARPQFLRRFHSKRREHVTGEEAYGCLKLEETKRGEPFTWGGFSWSCVGHISHGYGPTLVWRVVPR